MSHTKEPWGVHRVSKTSVVGTSGFVVAACGGHMDNKRDPDELHSELLANARRIVACVNACAGISTEDLEVAGRLAAAEEATLRRIADQRDELLRLLGVHPSDDAMKFAAEASEHLHIAAVQRDELLAALKEAEMTLCEKLRRLGAEPEVSPTVRRSREVIAKAEAGQ